MRELIRPWKLATFAIGLALLLIGADYYRAPDWDYSISVIMAFLTYVTAPWSVRVIITRNWRMMPLGLLCYYVSVDGCYWLYWSAVKPAALIMREANFYASSCLYWLCGVIWVHTGDLRQLLGGPMTRPAEGVPDSVTSHSTQRRQGRRG
jgi:hypothetical protein